MCVLCAGLIVEAINFAGITLLKISPMIMTMIMGTVVNGFNYFYTRGIVSGSIPEQIMMIGRQAAGPFKTIVFIVILLLLLTGLGLRHLKLGKKMFLVGSNDNAAGLCGIRTERVRFAAYLFSGTFAAVSYTHLNSKRPHYNRVADQSEFGISPGGKNPCNRCHVDRLGNHIAGAEHQHPF